MTGLSRRHFVEDQVRLRWEAAGAACARSARMDMVDLVGVVHAVVIVVLPVSPLVIGSEARDFQREEVEAAGGDVDRLPV